MANEKHTTLISVYFVQCVTTDIVYSRIQKKKHFFFLVLNCKDETFEKKKRTDKQ